MKKVSQIVMANALDLSTSRAEAVSALVTAGATILSNDFGADEAIKMLREMIDEAASDWVVACARERASATKH